MQTERPYDFCFKFICVLVAGLMISSPLSAMQAETEACVAGQRDAETEVNGTVWFIAGCLGGVIGLVLSYAIEPTPPAARLLGKSPEYVALYTDCYKRRAKKIQSNNALGGCLAATLGYVIYVVVVLSAAGSSE